MLCPRARCVLLSVAVRGPRIVGGEQFTCDPTFIIFVIGGEYNNGFLVLSSVTSPGLWSNQCNFSRLRFGGMSSDPLNRTVLAVVRVLLTIDDDVQTRALIGSAWCSVRANMPAYDAGSRVERVVGVV